MIKLLKRSKLVRPGVKECSNHFTTVSEGGRVWDSRRYGQAIKDGNWYKQKEA